MIRFSICSALLLAACAGGPKRPDTNILGINAVGHKARGHNMLKDYDSDGNLKPGAQSIEVPINSLSDLQGWTCTDPQGLRNLKVFLKEVRTYAKDKCK